MQEELTDAQPVIAALEQHLEDYWDQGFTEGSTRQPQPGPANETLSQIRALVRNALDAKDAEIATLKLEESQLRASAIYTADLCTQALADIKLKDAEMAALKAELDTALLGVVRLSAEKHVLRQEAHDICMSRSLSLSRDGKHAEANEASKCASAVKFAKLDAALAQAVQPAKQNPVWCEDCGWSGAENDAACMVIQQAEIAALRQAVQAVIDCDDEYRRQSRSMRDESMEYDRVAELCRAAIAQAVQPS